MIFILNIIMFLSIFLAVSHVLNLFPYLFIEIAVIKPVTERAELSH